MTAELEDCKREALEIMLKVAPHFNGAHSFSMLLVLSDLVAQWIRAHPPQDVNRLGTMLIETISDRLADLERRDDEETVH